MTSRKHPRDITVVRPIPVPTDAQAHIPILGQQLFDQLYGSLFWCASTNSGKTQQIAHFLRHTTDRRCTVFIVCGTLHTDPLWGSIVRMLEKRKIKVVTFDSLKTSDGGDVLSAIVQTMKSELGPGDEAEGSGTLLPPRPKVLFAPPDGASVFGEPDHPPATKRKKPEPKTRVAKFHLVLDDLPRQALRGTSMADLLKQNRHYQCRVLLSSQHLVHLAPDAFSNLNRILIGRWFSQSYIQRLWSRINLQVSAPDFFALYQTVVSQPFRFLNIDLRTGDYKVNFGKIRHFRWGE